MTLSALDRIDIHELTTKYGVHHDKREFEALRQCFTPEATYIMRIADGTVYGPCAGSAAIIEQIKQFKEAQTDYRRHHISNIQVTLLDADTASVESYLLISAVEAGVLSFRTVGNYIDTVVRTDKGWRIRRKELCLDTPF